MSYPSKTNWKNLNFWRGPYWKKVLKTLSAQKDVVVPEPKLIFRPLIETPLHKTRVVMIFPEPYPRRCVADGLALSFKTDRFDFDTSPVYFYELFLELQRDTNIIKKPTKGDLGSWARQGVLLWNARPTTVEGHVSGHFGIGWEYLTKEIIETAYLNNPDTVFAFFGTGAAFENILPKDAKVLKFVLPQPSLNGKSSFAGSRPFTRINKLLKEAHEKPIYW